MKRFKSTLLSFVFLLFLASSVVAQNGPAAQMKSKVKWADVEETPVDLAGYGITDAVTSEELPTNASFTLAGLGEKDFSSLTNKPTTLAGYGITDAAPSEVFTDCMRKTVRVQLNSAAKVSLMSLLNTQFAPCGELRVVCNTTNAAINVVLNGSNSVTMQYGTNSAAADEASKLCVYYDENDFDYYLKNNLMGTRVFIVEYLGRN